MKDYKTNYRKNHYPEDAENYNYYHWITITITKTNITIKSLRRNPTSLITPI